MAEIKIDESVLIFGIPKYHLGQKVQVDVGNQRVQAERKTGYVIGVMKGSFVWEYMILESDPPTNNTAGQWRTEFQIIPFSQDAQ